MKIYVSLLMLSFFCVTSCSENGDGPAYGGADSGLGTTPTSLRPPDQPPRRPNPSSSNPPSIFATLAVKAFSREGVKACLNAIGIGELLSERAPCNTLTVASFINQKDISAVAAEPLVDTVSGKNHLTFFKRILIVYAREKLLLLLNATLYQIGNHFEIVEQIEGYIGSSPIIMKGLELLETAGAIIISDFVSRTYFGDK